ncbi:unnamed protein product [Adineta steineri]|uniref:Transmembrane protein 242 n=1 Tax=Adineta steineri TaxID=433720 RepID=A0A815F4G8_9BILA|nr:unnamed protein product [Adineta steineri]CAF3991930.1 unnamed protein product [Adineta steineri]
MATSITPKLIFPEDKSTNDTNDICNSSISSSSILPSINETATKKLTKILSTQSSFDRHHPSHRIAKRFSIDADPSAVISNTPVTDLSNNPLQQPSTPDIDELPSTVTSINSLDKEPLAIRSPSLKKSDSFLEIPYEKGEIVDLIKLADDPDAVAHVTNDGQEVLLEHGAISYDAINTEKEKSREARNAFISNRLLPGVYFAFITACGLLGGFGFALGRTKKRETTAKLTRQANATQIFDDGNRLAVRALRRASIYSVTGVLSFTCFLWLISGRPNSFEEFRLRIGSSLPSIKSKKSKGEKEEQGRTEFESLTEFMQYLSDEDKKLKEKKKELSKNIKDI